MRFEGGSRQPQLSAPTSRDLSYPPPGVSHAFFPSALVAQCREPSGGAFLVWVNLQGAPQTGLGLIGLISRCINFGQIR
jgi:hypothetical protein